MWIIAGRSKNVSACNEGIDNGLCTHVVSMVTLLYTFLFEEYVIYFEYVFPCH